MHIRIVRSLSLGDVLVEVEILVKLFKLNVQPWDKTM